MKPAESPSEQSIAERAAAASEAAARLAKDLVEEMRHRYRRRVTGHEIRDFVRVLKMARVVPENQLLCGALSEHLLRLALDADRRPVDPRKVTGCRSLKAELRPLTERRTRRTR